MQVLKLMTFSFWCGFMTEAGISMAVQDWHGLEGYIEFLREHWINFHWLVGASIAFIALFIYMGRRLRVLNFLERSDSNEQAD